MSESSPTDPPELADLLIDYTRSALSRSDVAADPMTQFRSWLDEALASGIYEPNAATLSTVSADGAPSSRIVLLKGLGLEGGAFHFYTNYESRKGRELAANPRAALNFHWKELQRQVCIRGPVEKLDRASSEKYFVSRPYDSQIGAWVSTQSAPIPDRAWLEQRAAELRAKYPEGSVPLPPYWGGYRLLPHAIEFWQGRPGRLHDRILFQAGPSGAWTTSRLSP